jgi:hypothetical protein
LSIIALHNDAAKKSLERYTSALTLRTSRIVAETVPGKVQQHLPQVSRKLMAVAATLAEMAAKVSSI